MHLFVPLNGSSGRKERKQDAGWWGQEAAVTQGKMTSQVPLTEFFLVYSRQGLSAHPAKLSLCHLAEDWGGGRGGDGGSERGRGTRRKGTRDPHNPSLGSALLFDQSVSWMEIARTTVFLVSSLLLEKTIPSF